MVVTYKVQHSDSIDLEETIRELLELNRKAIRGIVVPDMMSVVA